MVSASGSIAQGETLTDTIKQKWIGESHWSLEDLVNFYLASLSPDGKTSQKNFEALFKLSPLVTGHLLLKSTLLESNQTEEMEKFKEKGGLKHQCHPNLSPMGLP